MNTIKNFEKFFALLESGISHETVNQALGDILPQKYLTPRNKNLIVTTHTFFSDSLYEKDFYPFLLEYKGTLVAFGYVHANKTILLHMKETDFSEEAMIHVDPCD